MSQIAVYKGKEYDATLSRSSGCAWIRSQSPDDLKNGFERKNGVYSKKVPLSEIEAVYRVTQYAVIDGIEREIMGETDSHYIVVFDNTFPEDANRYGLRDTIDNCMYKKEIPKSEVEIRTERKKYKI